MPGARVPGVTNECRPSEETEEGRFFVVPKTSKSQKVLYLQLSFLIGCRTDAVWAPLHHFIHLLIRLWGVMEEVRETADVSPGGWPGVRNDNSNYRGTGGCSSVPLNGDQNIFVLDLLMKSSWEVSWSSEIVLRWTSDWYNALGTDQNFLWMQLGTPSKKENCPLCVSVLNPLLQRAPLVWFENKVKLSLQKKEPRFVVYLIFFYFRHIKLFHWNRYAKVWIYQLM